MRKFGLFVVMVAAVAALAAAFAPMAWADAIEPPEPDICALFREQAQLAKASVLPERKDLWRFIFSLGVRLGSDPGEPAFQVTGWSRQENVLVEIENSPLFLLGFGPSTFGTVGQARPAQAGVAGFLKFYEDSRSRLALFGPEDFQRVRPYHIPQIHVGLEGSAFHASAFRFETNVTRPLVCAAFEAVRQGRVDRPVVILAVENVGFCQDLSGPEPQICGLNISGRIVGISYRPEIPSPPPPSTQPDGRG